MRPHPGMHPVHASLSAAWALRKGCGITAVTIMDGGRPGTRWFRWAFPKSPGISAQNRKTRCGARTRPPQWWRAPARSPCGAHRRRPCSATRRMRSATVPRQICWPLERTGKRQRLPATCRAPCRAGTACWACGTATDMRCGWHCACARCWAGKVRPAGRSAPTMPSMRSGRRSTGRSFRHCSSSLRSRSPSWTASCGTNG